MASPSRALEAAEKPRPTIDGDIEITPNQIAALAYEYWQDRGCPNGSPELDWLKAEADLQNQAAADQASSVITEK
jgi:hypothetical protein